MEKIELIYEVYVFGFNNVLINHNPIQFLRRNTFATPLTFVDFKVEFGDMLVRHTMTEDMFYDRLKPAIHFLTHFNLI